MEVVDLGLPSSTKWAKSNLGSSNETDNGLYYSWGNVIGHGEDGYEFSTENYSSTPGSSLNNNIEPGGNYDAATALLGIHFRIPTLEQINELISNCDRSYQENYQNSGKNGYKFTSRANGNFIFIPLAGRCNENGFGEENELGDYWTATIDSSDLEKSIRFFLSPGLVEHRLYYRHIGCTIRPVFISL